MRKTLFLILAILLVSPVFAGLPTKYVNYNITVNIGETGVIEEEINLFFPKSADTFNYYIIHRVRNLRVFAGSEEVNCASQYERTGTLISCQNFNSSTIKLTFSVNDLITDYDTYKLFSDRYIISTPTDQFTLQVFLPRGHILAEEDGNFQSLPYYPEDGIQKTDGKSIYLEWSYEPNLGRVYEVSVFYEPVFVSDQLLTLVVVVVVGVIIAGILLWRRKPQKIEDLGLREDEKKFLEILSKEDKLTQKKISREINLSKAQVSRIAATLEKRGLIERIRRGRNYEVKLKRV